MVRNHCFLQQNSNFGLDKKMGTQAVAMQLKKYFDTNIAPNLSKSVKIETDDKFMDSRRLHNFVACFGIPL